MRLLELSKPRLFRRSYDERPDLAEAVGLDKIREGLLRLIARRVYLAHFYLAGLAISLPDAIRWREVLVNIRGGDLLDGREEDVVKLRRRLGVG